VAGTLRHPRSRPPKGPLITEAALAAFKRMKECSEECTCEPIDWDGDYSKYRECAACDEWWRQHSILHKELNAKLWEWPCVEHPDATCPYPAGTYAAESWKPDVEAQWLWRELDAALMH